MILIAALVYGGAQMAPDAGGLLHFGGWLVLLLAFGALFWAVFERHTPAIKRRVRQWLPKRPVASMSPAASSALPSGESGR